MEDAAAELDCARSRISQLETGRYGVRKPDLVALLRLYGALDQLNELEELRREGAKRGWWSTSKLPKWLQAYLGMEEDATSTQIFSLELIPGLLQTEDYAHAVHFGLPSDEVNRRVAARMQRQVRLTTQKNPLELSVVLSEAAVTRTLAMGELGIGQLRHLTEISTLPTIAIRVLPFSAGVHPSMAGSFTLLNFAPGMSPPVAYQEYAVGGHIVDDQEDVQKLSALYDQLQAQALDENRSLDMISELTRRAGG